MLFPLGVSTDIFLFTSPPPPPPNLAFEDEYVLDTESRRFFPKQDLSHLSFCFGLLYTH